MSDFRSEYFNRYALSGLNKVGDVIIPGTTGKDPFPSFSETGCIEHVDELLAVTEEEDVKALNIVLTVLNFLPAAATRGLFRLSLLDNRVPDSIGSALRMLNLALRGVPMSLYYSNFTSLDYTGKKVFDIIDYDVHCEPDPDFKNW